VPIPEWIVLLLWHIWRPLFWAGATLLCIALPLSFAHQRQKRISVILWPVGAWCLWSGFCAFFGWAVLTDHDNYTYGMGLERLGLPGVLWLVGGGLAMLWLRAGIRRSRSRTLEAGVAP
jgi:hypothetical protein